MSRDYFRPVAMCDPHRPGGAHALAGGGCWFDRVERLSRTARPELLPASELPSDALDRMTAPRPGIAGLDLSAPRLMGIVNVTPDSFSDGGQFLDAGAAIAQGKALAASGAAMLDIGGESTRPGAAPVSEAEELARTVPVIEALAGAGTPISIDTRNAAVARAALAAGAVLVNDVSAMAWDPEMAETVARAGVPVCLMHASGTPQTMQDDPRYDDVLFDVYDALAARVAAAETAGIPRARILVDPGIGFGKTLDHNLALLRRVSLFHGLGCAVLIGASRKRFIGAISGAAAPQERMAGSVAVALAAAAQGVQVLRVHDVGETAQALALWRAATGCDGRAEKKRKAEA